MFWAPEWTGAAVLNGHFPTGQGEIVGSLDAFWESERGGGWGAYPETMIAANTIMGLRVGYHSNNNWAATAYVENLTDEFTYDGMNNNGGILPSQFFGHRRPRTMGIRFSYEWE